MTIDFSLINYSSEHSLTKLENLQKTSSPSLYLLDNFLSKDLVDKLVNFVNASDTVWETQEDDNKGYIKSRQKINWIPDSVVEEAYTVFHNLTDSLNSLFNKKSKFSGITLWKDSAGFTVTRHSDNPKISYSIQIYLANGPQDLATVFEFLGEKIKAKFEVNCGYLMDNTPKLPHYVIGTVPNDFTRYSLYAVWTDQ